MTFKIDESMWRALEAFAVMGRAIPPARAFALRLLEEAIELCLATGASIADIDRSIIEAKANEQIKDLGRPYDGSTLGSHEELVGEVADVALLLGAVAATGNVVDAEIEVAAGVKVDRLLAAARNGTLHITIDGRLYRRRKASTGLGRHVDGLGS